MNIYCFLRVKRSAYKEVYPRFSTINSDDLLHEELQWLLPAAAGDTLLPIAYKITLFRTRTRYLTQHTHTHHFMIIFVHVYTSFPSPLSYSYYLFPYFRFLSISFHFLLLDQFFLPFSALQTHHFQKISNHREIVRHVRFL
jgi:hypothetical protein